MELNIPVLLVGNFLSAAGGSRGVCEELAVRLAANGTTVFTTSSQPMRIRRLWDMLSTIYKKRHQYAVAQVDVYSGPAFFWAEAACALLRWLNKPFVLTLHGGNLPNFARKHSNRVQRLLASADAVTTPSRYLLEQMTPYKTDLRLLLNALDLSQYTFIVREQANPTLTWLRAFHEIYNPSLAPRVAGLLAAQFPEMQLTMIGPDKGDGSLQRTREQANSHKVQLTLPGGVSKAKVPLWLNRADIFLNTTNVDNAPVSVLEAMACGLCVVSTNVGGLTYLLEDGHNALLVPPDDAEAMARAVSRIITNPELAKKLSQNARVKAKEHDWSRVLPQWHDLFHSIVKSGRQSFQSHVSQTKQSGAVA
ncbi:MAG: putative glycosyltransferase [Pedosphaera sp.]|nr:putative glycosyltransferase [Pedosphaera sp.]